MYCYGELALQYLLEMWQQDLILQLRTTTSTYELHASLLDQFVFELYKRRTLSSLTVSRYSTVVSPIESVKLTRSDCTIVLC